MVVSHIDEPLVAMLHSVQLTRPLPTREPDYECMFSGRHAHKVFCRFWFNEMVCQWPCHGKIKAADLIIKNDFIYYNTIYKDSDTKFSDEIQEAFHEHIEGIIFERE